MSLKSSRGLTLFSLLFVSLFVKATLSLQQQQQVAGQSTQPTTSTHLNEQHTDVKKTAKAHSEQHSSLDDSTDASSIRPAAIGLQGLQFEAIDPATLGLDNLNFNDPNFPQQLLSAAHRWRQELGRSKTLQHKQQQQQTKHIVAATEATEDENTRQHKIQEALNRSMKQDIEKAQHTHLQHTHSSDSQAQAHSSDSHTDASTFQTESDKTIPFRGPSTLPTPSDSETDYSESSSSTFHPLLFHIDNPLFASQLSEALQTQVFEGSVNVETAENGETSVEAEINVNSIRKLIQQLLDLREADEVKPELTLEEQIQQDAAESLLLQAQLHFNETSENYDLEKGLVLLEQAADAGSSVAAVRIGANSLFEFPRNFTKAQHYLTIAAEQGDARSQHLLAFMHALGIYNLELNNHTLVPDAALSLLYDSFAAHGRDVNIGSNLALAHRYLQGRHTVRSCESAVAHYSRVARQVVSAIADDPRLEYFTVERQRLVDSKGRHALSGEQDTVVQYYRQAAAAGNVEAQTAIGTLMLTGGQGVERDPPQAAHFLQQAAARGSDSALVSLAKWHLMQGDNETAVELFERAAKRGSAAAAAALGELHLHAIASSTPNHTAALQWFERAAAQQQPDAQFGLAGMLFEGVVVERNLNRASALWQAAASQNHIRALFNLAHLQLSGIISSHSHLARCSAGVQMLRNVASRGEHGAILEEAYEDFLNQDYDRSFLKYALAAHRGYMTGAVNAAFLLQQRLVQWDGAIKSVDRVSELKLARYLYNMAALDGDSDAERMLGDLLYEGAIDSPSESEAIYHYQTASEMSNAQSSFNLGWLYLIGSGVEQRDLIMAKRYFDLSITQDNRGWLPNQIALSLLSCIQTYESITSWFGQFQMLTINSKATAEATAATSLSTLQSDWLESLENGVLVVLCGVFAVLIYIRSRQLN